MFNVQYEDSIFNWLLTFVFRHNIYQVTMPYAVFLWNSHSNYDRRACKLYLGIYSLRDKRYYYPIAKKQEIDQKISECLCNKLPSDIVIRTPNITTINLTVALHRSINYPSLQVHVIANAFYKEPITMQSVSNINGDRSHQNRLGFGSRNTAYTIARITSSSPRVTGAVIVGYSSVNRVNAVFFVIIQQ